MEEGPGEVVFELLIQGVNIYVHSHLEKTAIYYTTRGQSSTQLNTISVLEFSNNLWGLGTELDHGLSYGTPGYTAWRNWFLGLLQSLNLRPLFYTASSVAPQIPLNLRMLELNLGLLHCQPDAPITWLDFVHLSVTNS